MKTKASWKTCCSMLETEKASFVLSFVVVQNGATYMTVLTDRIDGRRESGGPRRQWYDDIKEWTGNHLYTSIKLAHNRVTWRRVASRPSRAGMTTTATTKTYEENEIL